MWQSSHTRHTQRSARRRSHLGVLVCLMAALFFTGVLLGRMSDGAEPTGHIYLSETAPPLTPKATPTPKPARPRADRIARATTTATALPRGRSRVQPTRTPTGDLIPGYTAGDPTRVLGEEVLQLSPAMAAKVVSLTNSARLKRGCGPLRVDARLTRSARAHSMEMAKYGRLVHESPDGGSPWDRMERTGYRAGAAENIGRGYASPEEAVQGWLDSRDHRQNILNCRIRAIGVGVVSGAGGPWWTQDFGYS
ncbi:CAP domain-containing protein [Nonomuraea sp. NPDC050383]|uniref:CAP domain-containing protein n=1 Tax=Nonomuraea sp. NPDC050383 TaxID=3364362 RepID=UPI0037AF711B